MEIKFAFSGFIFAIDVGLMCLRCILTSDAARLFLGGPDIHIAKQHFLHVLFCRRHSQDKQI